MNFNKRSLIVFVSILLIVIISMFATNKINFGKTEYVVSPKEDKYIDNEESDSREEISLEGEDIDVENENSEIVVFISGEVSTCGVVKMGSNSRLVDAVEKLGGLTQNADMNRVNLAIKVEDGAHYIIPSVYNDESQVIDNEVNSNDSEECLKQDSYNNSNSRQSTSSKIDINKASSSELKSLTGIGDVTASKIIEYRSQNGKFKTIDEIRMVKGIGEKKFESIKNDIKVN
ncbi:helix-hairpin-helix domain-containing protein [Tepidibacter hydrothermalis]|uniref:Helix-hairpin-helix domain-containing protein n=1 Tax=Tepidibacter hydrothermalis TaxID=3036126 RepID=A0ABY8EF17_9FIRM|nr:helix-hairpin-helix domain-containing protein [Tepidibacter hydrothermalis]WFD11542.1 helix-hairpin-helix domain-containing protein [Tepidibacter hydrothermalis]